MEGEFHINPNALYSKKALSRRLQGICHVETFLRGLDMGSPFKGVYLGSVLLKALTERRVNQVDIIKGDQSRENKRSKASPGKQTKTARGKGNVISIDDVLDPEG